MPRPSTTDRSRTIALRGALIGGLFALAAVAIEIWLLTIGKMKVGVAAPRTAFAEAVLLEVGLGVVIGLAAAPLLRLRFGAGVHLGAVFVAWVALGVAAGIPERSLHRTLLILPWLIGLLLAGAELAAHRHPRARHVPLGMVIGVLVTSLVLPDLHSAWTGPERRARPRASAPASAPDVLMVVLDTVRADHVGAYGYARGTTPIFDALAAEGGLFEDATTPATWSLPAHASLFTGRFVASHGAHAEHRRLGAEHATIAETFAAAGYDTRCFTANAWINDTLGLTRGFAWSDEAWRSGEAGRTRLYAFRLLERFGLGANDNGGAAVAANFEDWARSTPRSEGPTFVFVNFIEAHFPYHQVPESFLNRFTRDDRGELRVLSDALVAAQFGGVAPDPAGAAEPATAMYDAGVAYADHLLGRLIEALRARGTLDRTVIVVLSDHGELLGERAGWGHGHTVREAEVRVPLLVRYPPTIGAGARSETPVSTAGVFATLTDLAELPTPHSVQVGSLTGALRGGPAGGPVIVERFAGEVASSLTASAQRADPMARSDVRFRAYRSGPLKLVVDSEGGAALFDVVADPLERDDLAATRPDDLERLRRELDAWSAAIDLPGLDGAAASSPAPVLDDEARERLRALGYLE